MGSCGSRELWFYCILTFYRLGLGLRFGDDDDDDRTPPLCKATPWGRWSKCTQHGLLCGRGVKRRSRKIISWDPSGCPVNLVQVKSCGGQNCPLGCAHLTADGAFKAWGKCSALCGDGTSSRFMEDQKYIAAKDLNCAVSQDRPCTGTEGATCYLHAPTVSPTPYPSAIPTAIPTSKAPTALPTTTGVPTRFPTTGAPTNAPTSAAPSSSPSATPTNAPTSQPTDLWYVCERTCATQTPDAQMVLAVIDLNRCASSPPSKALHGLQIGSGPNSTEFRVSEVLCGCLFKCYTRGTHKNEAALRKIMGKNVRHFRADITDMKVANVGDQNSATANAFQLKHWSSFHRLFPGLSLVPTPFPSGCPTSFPTSDTPTPAPTKKLTERPTALPTRAPSIPAAKLEQIGAYFYLSVFSRSCTEQTTDLFQNNKSS
jgi:hypothetical protein